MMAVLRKISPIHHGWAILAFSAKEDRRLKISPNGGAIVVYLLNGMCFCVHTANWLVLGKGTCKNILSPPISVSIAIIDLTKKSSIGGKRKKKNWTSVPAQK